MNTEAITTTSEFKFDCPSCGQHILVSTEWGGRQIKCPSCNSSLTIPVANEARQPKQGPPASPNLHAAPPARSVRDEPPTSSPTRVSAPKTSTAPLAKNSRNENSTRAGADLNANAPASIPVQPEGLRIAVLTPAIKLEVIRAVRRRIAEEAGWMAGRINGANAYAAKASNGEAIPVDPASPEATRFSLVGAFLLEFHLRRVAKTAAGRTAFLDEEIPGAARQVRVDQRSEDERERSEEPFVDKDVMSLSHEQCLAVLDVLEESYSQSVEHARVEKAKKNLGVVRLPDLVKKLENKVRVAPEDVAAALYHELSDVRRRLERLESRKT